MGEIVGRLIAVLFSKRILNLNDVAFIMGEKLCRQTELAMIFMKNGIYTEEDLKKAMEEENDKH